MTGNDRHGAGIEDPSLNRSTATPQGGYGNGTAYNDGRDALNLDHDAPRTFGEKLVAFLTCRCG